MPRSRSALIVLLLSSVLLALAGELALAKGPIPAVRTLKVTPKRPLTTDTLHVSFIAGKLRRDQRYDVSLNLLGGDRTYGNCVGRTSVRVRGIRRAGRRVQVDLSPVGANETGGGRFCPIEGTIDIARVDVEARTTLLATRVVKLRRDPRDPPSFYDSSTPAAASATPVRVDLLDGSSLLVQAPGRPDRTIPVGGSLRGELPSKFEPRSDLTLSLGGTLALHAVVPDELCAGSTYVSELPLISPPALMVLKASGEVTFTPVLGVPATALAGCANPLAGTTALPLTGKAGPKGLTELALSGGITGVRIADGVTATVTANLLVKVDLSGK